MTSRDANGRTGNWNFVKYGIASLLLLLLPIVARAQIQITLKNSFIEKQKNRVTVDATFTVDKAHKTPAGTCLTRC